MKKICERCKEEDPDATPEALISLGIPEKFSTKVKAMRGRGCDHCGNSGNKGRVAIHEVLVINDDIREAILKGIPTDQMKKIAMKNGMNSLRQSALNNMAKGITSMAEVVRTTDDK